MAGAGALHEAENEDGDDGVQHYYDQDEDDQSMRLSQRYQITPTLRPLGLGTSCRECPKIRSS